MSKIVKKPVYKTVSFGSNGYNDLHDFAEVTAESNKKGELRVSDNAGSWRLAFSQNLYRVLGTPGYVSVLMSASKIAFRAVPEGTPGAYEVCSGEYIYSVKLAEKIMELATNVEFKPNATTRCGRIEQVQTDADNSITVILGFD